MRAVWQVSGGMNGRYAEVFLKHGVALIDPGDAGSWQPDRTDADFGGTAYGGSHVRRFATGPRRGDIVLLRTGAATIRAVGLIASTYRLPTAVNFYLLRFITIASCLYALLDIRSDLFTLAPADSGFANDAVALSRLTGIPSIIWAGLWLIISLVLLVFFLNRATRVNSE